MEKVILLQSVFEHPSVKSMIEKADKKEEKVFDAVVVCCALYGEEPGYYLAHRVNDNIEIYSNIMKIEIMPYHLFQCLDF